MTDRNWELIVRKCKVAKTVVVVGRTSSSGQRVVGSRPRVVALIVVVAKVETMAACKKGRCTESKKRHGAES